MIKTLAKAQQQERVKFRVPRSVQDAIPIRRIWSDGIFLCGNQYSKTWSFTDINYAIAGKDDKTAMFLDYSELLNALDSGASAKITLCNRRVNKAEFERSVLLPMKGDTLDEYRREFNEMLLAQTAGSNSIVRERYLTVSVVKRSIDEARAYFARVGTDLVTHFAALSSVAAELPVNDRLRIFRDFFKVGQEPAFEFNIAENAKRGQHFKDWLCPDSMEFAADHFKIDGRFGRVLYLQDFASYLKDSFVSELCDLDRDLMLSIDILPVPTDEAARQLQNTLLGVETNAANWQRRQNANNNFSAAIPYDMELQRKETKEMLDDLTTRDQRMMFGLVTLVHLADSKRQLDSDTETLLSVGRKHAPAAPAGREEASINESANAAYNRTAKQKRLPAKEKAYAVKTAPHGIRGVNRDQKQIRTAANTVQAERTAQQKAQQFAQRTQQAAKNATKKTRKVIKVVRSVIRHFLAALRTLTAAIVAGMSAATAIIVIICLVAFIAGSAYGIFFAAEAPDENSITVQQAVEQLTGEYRDELEHISDTVPHDRQEIETNDGVYYIRWQDVLAVFSSRVSGAADGAPIAALDEARLDELREILWDMNEVSYTTREETVEVSAQNANTEASRDTASESTANDSGARSQESNEADTTTITQTVLTIHLTHKTPEEMQTAYNFTARQAEYLTLLQDPKYETLWAELLGGFAAGDSEILTPDTTRTPTGSLQWPLPIPGSITSPFGYRTDPLTGETSYHDGTDIAAPEGTPILAAADGTVTVANALDSWGGSYGYYVQIDHGSGLQTLYAHCCQVCVTQGQQVQAGQVIAYVGHTGRATGNHLHFEVRENGERVDAMRFYS